MYNFSVHFDSTLNFDKFLKKYQSKSWLLVKLRIGNFSKREVDVIMKAFAEFLVQRFFKITLTVALNLCKILSEKWSFGSIL